MHLRKANIFEYLFNIICVICFKWRSIFVLCGQQPWNKTLAITICGQQRIALIMLIWPFIFCLMSIQIDIGAKVADFLHSDFMTSLIPNDCKLQGNKCGDNYSLRERGKECRGNNPSYLSFLEPLFNIPLCSPNRYHFLHCTCWPVRKVFFHGRPWLKVSSLQEMRQTLRNWYTCQVFR